MTVMVNVEPGHPCDRCLHPLKFHAGPDRGSRCMIVDGRVWRGVRVPKGMRAKQCWCDGFVRKP